jgi:ABC-2 type transport system permease protein
MRRALRRILAITVKELRQLHRDRLSFGMTVVVPLVQSLLFGFAINQDVRHMVAGLTDLSGSQRARMLAADVQASQVARIERRSGNPEELVSWLRRGEVRLGLVIPRDLERRITHGERPFAQLLVDGTDPVTITAARGLVDLPVAARRSQPSGGREGTFEMRVFFNPERRSPVHIVPGLIGVILTLTMVLFTSVAIARERERGNLELLITTPVRRAELMAGKILPYIGIGLLQVTLILALGVMVFRVPIQGSLVDLYLGALLFVAASLAMGLLISIEAQTQFQAFEMTAFFFLPSLLLSGFMFPFDSMPELAQGVGELLPLTHFVRISRAIVVRGARLGELSADLWPLAAFLAVTLALAVVRIRKRLGRN